METKVRYLVDTNVWLELLLDQEKSSLASAYFDMVLPNEIFISDFTLHSIGVILSRYKKHDVFEKFIDDIFVNAQIEQLSLDTLDLMEVIANIRKFKLDFDDSYQLSLAQKYELTIVTFDKDFNAKGIKKISPDDFLKMK